MPTVRIVVTLAAAAIAVGVLAWQRHAADTLDHAPAAAPRAAASSAPKPAAPRPAIPLPAQARAQVWAAPLPAAGLSLGTQVERLLATHEPQAAFTAYALVAGCSTFNGRHDYETYDPALRANRAMTTQEKEGIARMCGAMTERERQSRLDYLAIAVKAGVPGAAWVYANEGPFGDTSALKTRPDDPLVREWKATANAQLTQAAEAGDLTTLMVWSYQNLAGSDVTDKNPLRGYTYLLAAGLIEADRFGPSNPTARQYADGSEFMTIMGHGLTPEQRAAALAAARKIAANARRQQQGAARPAASTT